MGQPRRRWKMYKREELAVSMKRKIVGREGIDVRLFVRRSL
jgi:hypothetical protein